MANGTTGRLANGLLSTFLILIVMTCVTQAEVALPIKAVHATSTTASIVRSSASSTATSRASAASAGTRGLTPRLKIKNCLAKDVLPGDAVDQEPTRRLKQLTMSPCMPAKIDISDPSLPFDDQKGTLTVYGSGITSWSADTAAHAWKRFLRGETPTWQPLDLYYENGLPLQASAFGEEAWDVTIEHFDGLTESIVYGGVMKPRPGQDHALYPIDNPSRRTRSFQMVNGHWTENSHSIFTDFGEMDWLGHNYGHQFFKDDDGTLWMFYERVSTVTNGDPTKTEIFARRFTPPTTLYGEEVAVFKIPTVPYPAVVRATGNLLAEGPRPFVAHVNGQKFYFVSFSSSDWASNRYGINILWSRKVEGPYLPVLNQDQSDLLDLGADLRAHHALTFGPGRASFFQDPDSKWWCIFHASRLPHSTSSQTDAGEDGSFQRNYFLAPVRIELVNGTPKVRVLEND